jgi:hypothetical protein
LFNIIEGIIILDGAWRFINLLAFLKIKTLFYLLNRLHDVFTFTNTDYSDFMHNIIELIRLAFKVIISGHVSLLLYTKLKNMNYKKYLFMSI